MKCGIAIILLSFAAFLQTQAQTLEQVITGKVTDKNSNPIELAVIVIQTTDSAYICSSCTDSAGIFTIKSDVQSFLLTAQHLSYETFQHKYDSHNVGIIEMNPKDIMIADISVKGEMPLVRVIDGKMTYNIGLLTKNKIASSAYEAIMQLPGVQQLRGKIELAGTNNVTVIINGKRTNMGESQLENLLKSMPKERILEAEIIYSAPAQYHVRGAVINLILKNEAPDTPKLQGQINTSYDQGHYANGLAGATLVYNTPKTTSDFIYSFGYQRELTGEDILSHHSYNGKIYDIEQFDRGYTRTPIHTIRLGNDWRINDKNVISSSYSSEIQQWSHPFTSSQGTFSDSENSKRSDKPIQMHNISLGYTSGFGLSTGIDFTYYTNHTTQYYQEKMAEKEDAYNAKSKQDIRRLSLYADQSHQLGGNLSLTYGAKFSLSSDKSSQIYH